jgi:hypothetical protein
MGQREKSDSPKIKILKPANRRRASRWIGPGNVIHHTCHGCWRKIATAFPVNELYGLISTLIRYNPA